MDTENIKRLGADARGMARTASSRVSDQLRNIIDQLEDAALTAAAPAVPALTLTERLQQKCSDWGTYWRAPDAHGVILTPEQAMELLQDALGVEVEIKALATNPEQSA